MASRRGLTVWWPGQARRRAVKDAAQRRAAALAELEARREAERELADRETGKADRTSLTRVVARTVFRARRILTPFAVLAVLAALGWWGALSGVHPAAPLAVWLGVAAVVWRSRLRDRLHRVVERRYAAVCVTAGAAWLASAALSGPGAVDSLLVVGWAALSIPWWAHHWPRPRVEVPDVELVGDPIIALWDAHVADPQGPLPGARLVDPTPFEHGTEYRILLVPGRQPMERVVGKLPEVTQGIRTPAERAVIERHPGTDDPAIGRLRHVAVSPVRDTQWFERPRWDDLGRILLGPHADGMGDAVWRTYVRNGLYGGVLVGSPGNGKTRLQEALAVSVRAMSAAGWPTILAYVDGQDGASSPLLWRHATLRGGPGDAGLILDGLSRLVRLRQQWNRVHGLGGFTPGASPDGGRTPGLPGVMVFADEFHALTADKALAKMWTALAREGRKVGVAVVAADQNVDLDVFGGQETLRASLIAGNGLAFHVASQSTGGLVPGLALDPKNIPAIPGFAYKIAAPQSGERTAPFRARYMPDAKDADDDPDLPVPTVEEWFTKTSDAPVDDMTARGLGEVYTNREAREETARRAAMDEIEGRAPAEPERIVVAPGKSVKTADVVEQLLRQQGSMPRAEIVNAVEILFGTGPDAVKAALRDLLTRGAIVRLEHGVYALTGTTQAAA